MIIDYLGTQLLQRILLFVLPYSVILISWTFVFCEPLFSHVRLIDLVNCDIYLHTYIVYIQMLVLRLQMSHIFVFN